MITREEKIFCNQQDYKTPTDDYFYINPIQDGLFRGCSRMGWGPKRTPLTKIRHTHTTMMKFGSYTLAKGDPKNI